MSVDVNPNGIEKKVTVHYAFTGSCSSSNNHVVTRLVVTNAADPNGSGVLAQYADGEMITGDTNYWGNSATIVVHTTSSDVLTVKLQYRTPCSGAQATGESSDWGNTQIIASIENVQC